MDRSWSTDGRKISDLAFENDGLWVSISGLGARRINLTTNAVTGSSSGLHANIGTLTLWEDKSPWDSLVPAAQVLVFKFE